jgi:CspA family cold shock protein
MSEPRRTGTLKFWHAERGFGFLVPDDGGESVFLGRAGLERAGLLDEPAAGDRFSFIVGRDRQGRNRAEEIGPIPETAAAARVWPPREPVRP